jgi:hypothetical protein
MRTKTTVCTALRLLALALFLALAAMPPARADAPMTKLTILVKTAGGRPVDRAGVVVRFVQGRSYVKMGKKVRTTFELRTNQEGEARVPSIPQGQIRVQVIAKGYQTFGQVFDVGEDEKTIEVTLNPPQQQYSAH